MRRRTFKQKIMDRYNLTAHIYDVRYYEEQTHKIKESLKMLQNKRFSKGLDVGCGTGILFNHIIDKVSLLVGLDISLKTLLIAKKRAKFFHNIHLILGDADNLPLRDNFFDNIFGFTIIQNIPQPIKTLKEIKRVATNNSSIIITSLKKFFPKRKFEKILEKAGLKILLTNDTCLNYHIAICK